MKCDPFGMLKILSAFLLCSLIGWFLWQPAHKKALVLRTYNEKGELESASVTWENGNMQGTNRDTKLEQPQGAKQTVQIKPDNAKRYGPAQSIELTWMSKEDYAEWLKTELPKALTKDHVPENKKSSITKDLEGANGDLSFIFPVFLAPK